MSGAAEPLDICSIKWMTGFHRDGRKSRLLVVEHCARSCIVIDVAAGLQEPLISKDHSLVEAAQAECADFADKSHNKRSPSQRLIRESCVGRFFAP
jgi:hypothetical protein